jgi:hypothetical protein
LAFEARAILKPLNRDAYARSAKGRKQRLCAASQLTEFLCSADLHFRFGCYRTPYLLIVASSVGPPTAYRLDGHAEDRIDALSLENARRWVVAAAARSHPLNLTAAAAVGDAPALTGSREIPHVARLRPSTSDPFGDLSRPRTGWRSRAI